MLKPRVAAPDKRPAVVVDIDEASLRALGQWPWPRTMIAELVDKLQKAGAVVVAFDILMSEADRMSPANVAQSLPQIDAATRDTMKSLPSNDEVLASVIAKRWRGSWAGRRSITPTPPPDETAGIAMLGADPTPFLFKFAGLLRNIPVLDRAAAGRGNLTLVPERDGVVRRVPLIAEAAGQKVPALTMEILRVATGAGALLINTDKVTGIQWVAIQGVPVQILRPTRTGGSGSTSRPTISARFVSAKDVMEGNFPADRFQGRVALIGTSAAGLLDLKTTPVEVDMPGVEVHAQNFWRTSSRSRCCRVPTMPTGRRS